VKKIEAFIRHEAFEPIRSELLEEIAAAAESEQ
jgi:hypothetical protein